MGKKITITGSKIFDIGYRYFLVEQALGFGIERFRAFNLRKENKLLVFVEGNEEALNEFIEFVKNNFPEDAQVDNIEIEEYRGYVPKIDQFLLLFNVQQSRKFIKVGKEVGEKVDRVAEKIDSVADKIDQTREELGKKIDEVGRKVDKVAKKVDKVAEKVDKVGEKVDKTREELGDKIDMLRTDLKTYMEERFRRIEEEIARIKAKIGLT